MRKLIVVLAVLLSTGCANLRVTALYQSDAVLEDLKELKASTK
jgi:hypothetical protein